MIKVRGGMGVCVYIYKSFRRFLIITPLFDCSFCSETVRLIKANLKSYEESYLFNLNHKTIPDTTLHQHCVVNCLYHDTELYDEIKSTCS